MIKRYTGDELREFKAFIELKRAEQPTITSTAIAIAWAGGSWQCKKYFMATATLNHINRGVK